MLLLEAEAAVAQLDPLNDISQEEQVLGEAEPALGRAGSPCTARSPQNFVSLSGPSTPSQRKPGSFEEGALHGPLFVVWI